MTRFLMVVLIVATTWCGNAAGQPASSQIGDAGATCTARWQLIAHEGVPELTSIVAVSPTDVWAVGQSQVEAHGRLFPVIARWDGRALHRYTAPSPMRRHGRLNAVTGTGPDDVWAVGGDDANGRTRPVAMHWDGTRWRIVPIPPLLGNGELFGIAAVSPTDVWAVGVLSLGWPLILHWNGHRWHGGYGDQLRPIMPRWNYSGVIYGTELDAVVAKASNDVWAVGTKNFVDFAGFSTVVIHWNGHSWQRLATTDATASEASAISSDANDELWTLDNDVDYADASQGSGYYLTRWNDRTRRPIHTYFTPNQDGVSAITSISQDNAWLVGIHWSADGNHQLGPLVIHWDGTKGRIEHTSFATLRYATLTSLSALSPTDIWAAGTGLIARYAC